MIAALTIFTFVNNLEEKEVIYPEPSDYFFVEDYSGVLNEATERTIYDEAVKLYRATSAQVVVVTVPETQGESLEDFSNHLANQWGIGDEKLDNGVLILFETDETYPHVRMEVGKGLEGAIPDGKAGRILDDYAVEDKNNHIWNRAAGNTFMATLDVLYQEYGMEIPESVGISDDWQDGQAETAGTFADMPFPEPVYVKNTRPFMSQLGEAFLEAVIILFMFGWILIPVILFIINPSGGGGGGGSYHGGGSFGGSSGGGGFHGGGGSFGGGGASR